MNEKFVLTAEVQALLDRAAGLGVARRRNPRLKAHRARSA
jgi:hypothetical protein